MFKIRSLPLLLTATVFAVFINNPGYAASPKEGAKYGYHGDLGPQNWGKLDSQYKLCSTGKKQSPIDITSSTLTNHNALKINYGVSSAESVYDTTTMLNIHDKPTIVNDGHTLQVNIPQTGKEYITVNDQQYQLVQFHFHTPSENLINGKNFPIEIHFVNQSADGNIAVLGVMIKQGNYNAGLQEFLNELPNSKKALKVPNKELITISQLLPANKMYYTFDGSLTTPPCSEGLKWFVFATPLEASKQQINRLKLLLPDNNDRPVQPLNGREVMQSIAK